MIGLPVTQHIAAVTFALGGGTPFIGTYLIWYASYYWACVVYLIVRAHALACLRGWK